MPQVVPDGDLADRDGAGARAVIPLAWADVEALELGALQPGVDSDPVTGVFADSRVVGPGDLFVALNTGVQFVDDANRRGAATLVPHDQHAALAALAGLVRGRSRARVVAVVGSTGKTTTKDILGGLCAAVVPTVYPEESLNNEIGLPLTVCRLEAATRVLVTEMGMRGLGQIAALCTIARPHIALVTSIGPEHLELVGSVENAARANAEAIESLPPGGIAVVPDDAQELEGYLDREEIEVRRFASADTQRLADGRWRFRVGEHTVELALPFAQRHLATNALAALVAFDALGLPLERAPEGAGRIELSRWRGEERLLPGGGFVINDAYNANPTSMRAALLHLSERAEGRRRVAILGEMAELGDHADAYHREIGELLAELGIEVIVAIGARSRRYADRAAGATRLLDEPVGFEDLLRPGDAVLVKASRAVGLEGIPERIANLAEAWSAS